MSKPTKQLCVLHNEAEARELESILAGASIEVTIVRNQETADSERSDRDTPWGTAEVSKEQYQEAKPLWKEWRSAHIGEIGEEWKRRKRKKKGAGSGRKDGELPTFVIFLLGLGVGALAMYVVDKALFSPRLDGWIECDYTDDGIVDALRLYENGVLTAERMDINRDGEIDQWWRFSKGDPSDYRADRDFDGEVDEWGYCDETGVVARLERDLNRDGKIDIWEEFEHGKYEGGKQDTDYDGKVDEWWRSENGTVVERHWSFDGSGKIDKKAYYRNGVKTKELFDLDHDGEFETTKNYDRFEQEIAAEAAKP